MTNFMNEFTIFFEAIFNAVQAFWTWLSGTTIGLIIIFMVIISIFLWLIHELINFKN